MMGTQPRRKEAAMVRGHRRLGLLLFVFMAFVAACGQSEDEERGIVEESVSSTTMPERELDCASGDEIVDVIVDLAQPSVPAPAGSGPTAQEAFDSFHIWPSLPHIDRTQFISAPIDDGTVLYSLQESGGGVVMVVTVQETTGGWAVRGYRACDHTLKG